MNRSRLVPACALAIVAGAAVWYLASTWTGGGEAWDRASYVWVVPPVLAVVIGLLGFYVGGCPWQLGLAGSVGQLLAMLVEGGFGSLWPVGVGVMLLLSLPSVAAAQAGAVLSRRRSRARRR